MTVTFTIPYPFLRAILTELRRQPYHVAVGEAGLNLLPAGSIEVLARSFRLVHEGALRGSQEDHGPRFELGFVPFTLNRPDVWQAVAFAARIEGDLPATPTCSILLGSGEDAGLFTGIFSVRDQLLPVQAMKIVGAGMHRLAAVDFQALRRRAISPDDAERWSRLIGALGGQDVWERLTSLSFCIIGTGRTGSLVAATLAKQGVHTLALIDPDVLERHNLDAMDAVTEHDLGRFKAEAMAENLERELPHAQITALPQSVITPEARLLVKSADVLVCCVDDDAARLVVGALACCYAKPLLDIGTGVFYESSRQSSAMGNRRMGTDVRLILPG
ncbi:MAG: ThiF family adenylyltransferase, partial [Anaerolineae bacterium]